MGDLNANTPDIRGLEFRPKSMRWVSLSSSAQGVLQRIRPGAVTVSAVNLYVPQLVGFPGTAIEILDTVAPATTIEYRFPGTDTGATTTGWVDQAFGAANFGEIDDVSTADYHANSVTGSLSTNSPRLMFRGASAISAGKRILSVRLYAVVGIVDPTFASGVVARGALNIGGVEYLGSSVAVPFYASGTALLGTWVLNPVTGIPWTLTEINALANGTDEFGVAWLGFAAAGIVRLSGMYLQIVTCTENRKGYLYGASSWVLGWKDYGALVATAATSANTWYWLHVWPLTANGANYVSFPFLNDPNVVMAASASATTGEHRQAGTTSLGEGGQILSYIPTYGDVMPALLEVAGAIQSQSFPYTELEAADVYSGAPVNFGTEITLPTVTTYGAVKITAGWATSLRPDGPLKIEVRSGGGSLTGGGTLHGTAFLQAADTLNASYNDYQVIIDTPFALGAAAVCVLHITSTTTSARPWRLALLDTRSDILTTTTATEVQDASFGWTTGGAQDGDTNSYFTAGTQDDRYDLAAALISAPAVGAFTATPRAAG